MATPGAMPSNSTLLGTEVKRSNEEIAHFIDASVASKFGSSMANAVEAISKSMADKFDEFKKQVSKDLGIGSSHHTQSLGQHVEDASANISQIHAVINSDQSGQNHTSSSAHNVILSVAPPIVSTSVAQNYDSNNRSRVLNPNLQQPYYQTVAYATPPSYNQFGVNSPPSYNQFGTNPHRIVNNSEAMPLAASIGVPYGPVLDAHVNDSPLQTSHAQTVLPENPSHAAPLTYVSVND